MSFLESSAAFWNAALILDGVFFIDRFFVSLGGCLVEFGGKSSFWWKATDERGNEGSWAVGYGGAQRSAGVQIPPGGNVSLTMISGLAKKGEQAPLAIG